MTAAIPMPTQRALNLETQRWWLTMAQAVAATLALALLGAAVFEVQDAQEGGVRQLQLEGAFQQIEAGEVRAAMAPILARGVFAIRLSEVQAAIESLSWVSHARVERAWPGQLRVRIWEHEPAARWNDVLLSTEAVAFRVPREEMPEGLPQLEGPEGHELEVLLAYQAFLARMGDSPLRPIGLALNARGEWTAQTFAGVELRLGRGLPAEQADFLRGSVMQALAERLAGASYVDLRYSNGFAVGEKAIAGAAGDKRK